MFENLLNTFVSDYVNYINMDIDKAAAYHLTNNNPTEFEKLIRIKNDIYDNVLSNFSKIEKIDEVKNITRLGDMHVKSNCTLLLEFDNKKVIYKPFHSHFLLLINQLIYLLNGSSKFSFYCLNLLSQKQNASYIEYIENEKPEDLSKFYYHYGALIFIITLLRGTDFHSDNIFCKSSTPIIVDYETFFYPHIAGFKAYSVEATSLIKTQNNKHTLMNHYDLIIDRLIAGIEAAFEIVSSNTSKFISIVNKHINLKSRVIFKPTSYYLNLLRKSSHPSLLSCRKLRKKYLHDSLMGKNAVSSVIMKYEIEDLVDFNIPSFYFENGQLYASNMKLISQNLISSSLNLIHSNLKNLFIFKKEIIDVIGLI